SAPLFLRSFPLARSLCLLPWNPYCICPRLAYPGKVGGDMFRTRITLVAAVAMGCLTLACGPKGPNDQALTSDIQAKLYANDATRGANVKVVVSNGAVTLSGDVPSSDVELQAMKIANSAAGVSGVTDQMKVNTALAAAPA